MNSFVIPKPYPKQVEFMKSRSHYTAYGGSRGGGKSFVARLKANMLCLRYDGIQILFMRGRIRSCGKTTLFRLCGS